MFSIGDVDPGATLATFVGPIVAVGITLWLQARDRARARREALLRQLLATRINPADPAFNVAIALVPVEFAHSSDVRTAHKDFMVSANRQEGDAVIASRQEQLILSMMEALGYDTEHARDAIREAYYSIAMNNSVKRQQEALEALPKLAASLETLAKSTLAMHQQLQSAMAAQGAAATATVPQAAPIPANAQRS